EFARKEPRSMNKDSQFLILAECVQTIGQSIGRASGEDPPAEASGRSALRSSAHVVCAAHESAVGRYCRKRFFWRVKKIFQRRWCIRRAPMWGTTSNHKKATTELRTRPTEACRSGGSQKPTFARFGSCSIFDFFDSIDPHRTWGE